ncbi:MAG: AAA family ATPase [Ktedonobacterales bacterium]|nr:AAA family ATPase [Ktedonobacterales bacterium]
MPDHDTAHPALVSTSVPGLDVVLGGGLFQGALVLIMGPPGSGKTTLATQIAFAAAQAHRKTIVFTALSESTTKLLKHLQRFAFFDASLIGVEIVFFSLEAFLADGVAAASDAVIAATRQVGAELVIIDGFRGITGVASDPQQARAFLFDVGAALSLAGTTTIINSEAEPRDPKLFPESTTADVILGLTYGVRDRRALRGIEAIKVRGGTPLPGIHALGLDGTGVLVYPRIETQAITALPRPEVVAALPPWAASATSLTTAAFGIPALDALLSGGVTRDTSTLLTGSLGTGKTLLALHFALAGVAAGEPVVMLSFRETLPQLLAKADAFALGATLRAGLAAAGPLTLIRWEPVELVPEQVLDHLLTILAQTHAQRLVIDSLVELQRAVTETSSRGRIANVIAALLAVLRQRKVTLLGVLETSVTVTSTPDFAADPLAILAENLLLLQHVGQEEQIQRMLTVLKMRFAPHTLTRYPFTIAAPEGIRLGPSDTDR